MSLCCCLVASAQTTAPLQYVHGDSIVMWSPDGSDFRSLGLHVDPSLKSHTITPTFSSTKDRKKKEKLWEKEVYEKMEVTGSIALSKRKKNNCCITHAAQMSAMLFLHTPQAKYFDIAERMLMNHAMRNVLQSGDNKEKHELAQTLCDAAGWVYATRGKEVFLNLYVNSTARIVTDSLHMIVDQITSLPHDSRVKIRISGLPHGKFPFTLRLRIPDWAVGRNEYSRKFAFVEQGKQAFPLYVNGREENLKIKDGYILISRKWNSGDEVFFDLPMPVRHLRQMADGTSEYGAIALQRGPWIYCAEDVAEDNCYVISQPAEADGSPTSWGNVRLIGTCRNCTQAPADTVAGATPFHASPFIEGKGQVWLKECH
jgi:DUF1680 family protein